MGPREPSSSSGDERLQPGKEPRGLLCGSGGASSSRWARLGDGLEDAKALWLLSVTLGARA